MVLTGLYLWWPRDGRSIARALLPRLHAGARIFWRDLQACVAVWFSALIVLFLLTALPWTHFWGGSVLKPLQSLLRQDTPSAAGFALSLPGPRRARPQVCPPTRSAFRTSQLHCRRCSMPPVPTACAAT